MTTTAKNKEAAVSFLKMVVAGKIREAYATYVSPELKHHNAYFAADAKTLEQGMQESHERFPHKHFEIKRVIGDGDIVATHSHVRLNQELDLTAVHMFRFQDDRIVEMWDIAQQIPHDSPNKNGMF